MRKRIHWLRSFRSRTRWTQTVYRQTDRRDGTYFRMAEKDVGTSGYGNGT